MTHWAGASAIVTGAGSGIGLALSEAMVARGAEVWLTDINGDSVAAAADRLGSKAHSRTLDICDAEAFKALAHEVKEAHGSLDFFFNNAGIGGQPEEAHRLTTGVFDRLIDVNIRGVTNGIAAVYPIMVEQGHGHIINTASASGLLPVPLMIPYTLSKHAVVGLSNSLRIEAENYGVRVSVLCPSAIETPILDPEVPEGEESTWAPNVRRYLTALGGPPYALNKFTAETMKAIERNEGVIISPASGRIAALLYRLFPRLVVGKIRKALAAELKDKPT